MKFHAINLRGKLHVQRLSTLPTFDSDLNDDGKPKDEGRIVYAEDTDGIFYGTSSDWAHLGAVLYDSYLDKYFRQYLYNGSFQLQEIVIS